MKVVTSFGACSPSSSSQSKPARPRTSVVIGLASEHQQPISVSPARRRRLNEFGKARYGSGDVMGLLRRVWKGSVELDAAGGDDRGPALLLAVEEGRELGR